METEKDLLKFLRTRLTAMETERRPFEALWQDIYDQISPRIQNLTNGKSNGKPTNPILNKKIYNGETGNMVDILVAGLQGNLIPSGTPWFALKVRDKNLTDVPGIRIWLKEVEAHIYSQLQSSNFYNVVTDLLYQGAMPGTGIMTIEENIKAGRPQFSVRNIKEIFIAEGPDGEVDTLFRRIWLDARNVLKKWPGAPDRIHKLAKDMPFEKIEIIHSIYPRADQNFRVKGQKGMPFASIYWSPNDEKVLSEGGFKSFPYLAWRWSKEQEEAYGRSPACDALIDVTRLNLISKTMLQVANYSANPAIAIPSELESSIGQAGLVPGGRFLITNPGNNQVQVLGLGQNYPVGVDREERITNTLKQHFRVDFFLMLQASERQKTATEIIELQAEKAAALASIVGRIQSEVLDPLFDRVFQMELNAGRLPPVPPEVLKLLKGKDIEVDYQGPLAQAQRKYHKTQGILESVQALGMLAGVKPEVWDLIDFDKAGTGLLEAYGMPPDVIKELKAVAMERAQRAEMAQMQMREQLALQQQSQIMGRADPNAPIQQGSILEGMQRNAASRAEQAQEAQQ